MGDVPIGEFLKGHNLLPAYSPAKELYICTISPEDIPTALEIATSIRKCGINAAVNLTDKKVGDQVKLADKKSVPFVMFIGKEERKNAQYMVKNMETGDERQLKEDEIPQFIKQTQSE